MAVATEWWFNSIVIDASTKEAAEPSASTTATTESEESLESPNDLVRVGNVIFSKETTTVEQPRRRFRTVKYPAS